MFHHHIFESGYANDGIHVYYRGERINSMTVISFEDLGFGYARDPFRVCFAGHIIDGAHPHSFEVLGDGYAKDTFHVYYQGEKMLGLMASTFVTLGNGYAKDSCNVYYYGRKAEGASPLTFHTYTHELSQIVFLPQFGIESLKYPIEDRPIFPIFNYFNITVDRIATNVALYRRTFLYCRQGRSCSIPFILAYLMKFYRLPLLTKFVFVKEKRQLVLPNSGF